VTGTVPHAAFVLSSHLPLCASSTLLTAEDIEKLGYKSNTRVVKTVGRCGKALHLKSTTLTTFAVKRDQLLLSCRWESEEPDNSSLHPPLFFKVSNKRCISETKFIDFSNPKVEICLSQRDGKL